VLYAPERKPEDHVKRLQAIAANRPLGQIMDDRVPHGRQRRKQIEASGARLAVVCPQACATRPTALSSRAVVLAAGACIEPSEEFIEPRASLGGQPGEVILAVRDLPIR
jgi:hypothetical protein